MNQHQIDQIPDRLLRMPDTRPLLDYLASLGARMTLQQLDDERHRRGITPPMRRTDRRRGSARLDEPPAA